MLAFIYFVVFLFLAACTTSGQMSHSERTELQQSLLRQIRNC
jgi:hypothetical protein